MPCSPAPTHPSTAPATMASAPSEKAVTASFEPVSNGSAHSVPAGAPLRETCVQQAVNFLNDPRVKNADQGKAVSFLRAKGISDEEVNEAYRRCGLPFPNIGTHVSAAVPGAVPGAGAGAVPFAPHFGSHVMQQQQHPMGYVAHGGGGGGGHRVSWISVFLGITAAAGLYTGIREVLRRYVVPMYFPDAARIAEERRRREDLILQTQEIQIAELREKIEQLVESSKRTNEKVESLSESVSTSIAQREREMSQNSELRDAIRNLSHSVTASVGTDISVVGSQSRDGRRISMTSIPHSTLASGDKSQKRGSLAYSYSAQHSEPLDPQVQEGSATRSSNGGGGGETGDREEEDEFMALEPAQVEKSWGGRPETTETGGVKVAAALKLFQSELLEEAKSALQAGEQNGAGGSRGRPLSMPQMEVPLSDSEE